MAKAYFFGFWVDLAAVAAFFFCAAPAALPFCCAFCFWFAFGDLSPMIRQRPLRSPAVNGRLAVPKHSFADDARRQGEIDGVPIMEIKKNGSQPSSKEPADWFTGRSASIRYLRRASRRERPVPA